MIVEEKLAGNYWCPFVRQLATANKVSAGGMNLGAQEVVAMAGINRVVGDEDGKHFMAACVGSKCMAWRWHRERAWEGSLTTGLSSQKEEISQTHGYCGLAGGAR